MIGAAYTAFSARKRFRVLVARDRDFEASLVAYASHWISYECLRAFGGVHCGNALQRQFPRRG